jgi:hypothetical protein
MSDQVETKVVEAKAEKAPKAPKEPKAPRRVLEKQNGVTRPGAGVTGKVWEIANALSKELGAPATRKAVMEAGAAQGINAATLATQYGRWCRFHGLTKKAVTPSATAPAAPAAAEVVVEETPKA